MWFFLIKEAQKKLPKVDFQLVVKNIENKHTFPKKIKKPLTAISSFLTFLNLFHHKFIVVFIFRIVKVPTNIFTKLLNNS